LSKRDLSSRFAVHRLCWLLPSQRQQPKGNEGDFLSAEGNWGILPAYQQHRQEISHHPQPAPINDLGKFNAISTLSVCCKDTSRDNWTSNPMKEQHRYLRSVLQRAFLSTLYVILFEYSGITCSHTLEPFKDLGLVQCAICQLRC
jgi:hypothetical protein